MKAPSDNQLTPAKGYEAQEVERAARDIVHHAVLECEKMAAGDPASRARLLFAQSQAFGMASNALLRAALKPNGAS